MTSKTETYDIRTEEEERKLRIKLLRDEMPFNESRRQNMEVLAQYYLSGGPLPRGDLVIYVSEGKLHTGTQDEFDRFLETGGQGVVYDVSYSLRDSRSRIYTIHHVPELFETNLGQPNHVV